MYRQSPSISCSVCLESAPGHSRAGSALEAPGAPSSPAGAERALRWRSPALDLRPAAEPSAAERAEPASAEEAPVPPRAARGQQVRLSLHIRSSDMGKLYVRPPLYLLRGFLWFKLFKRQSLKWFFVCFPDTCGF